VRLLTAPILSHPAPARLGAGMPWHATGPSSRRPATERSR